MIELCFTPTFCGVTVLTFLAELAFVFVSKLMARITIGFHFLLIGIVTLRMTLITGYNLVFTC